MQNAQMHDPVIFCAKMKKRDYKEHEIWICAVGLAILIAVFLLWLGDGRSVSAAGLLSALASTALFAVLCVRFVPQWMRFWQKAPAMSPVYRKKTAPKDADPEHIQLKIFVSLMLVNIAVVVLIHCMRWMGGYRGSLLDGFEFWTWTDSEHYLDIAKEGYLSQGEWRRLVQLVFLPGYPLVVRLVNFVVNNYLCSAMIVSTLSFAGAGCMIYRLLRLDYPHADAIGAIKTLCILPGAFFFAAPLSESFFLLLCASCLYCARTKKWAIACLLGGLASFTRSLGLVLFVPLFFELVSSTIRSGREGKGRAGTLGVIARFAALLLIPAGFGVYCYINYLVSGNPFKFMEYQSANWHQHLGWFFNTAAYQMEYAIGCMGTDHHNLLGLWLPNLISQFASLAVMIFAVKKMRPSYVAWFIAYFVIAMGATWLLSAPRYLVALLPVPLAVSQLMKKPKVKRVVLPICLLLSLVYAYAFAMRWQVW